MEKNKHKSITITKQFFFQTTILQSKYSVISSLSFSNNSSDLHNIQVGILLVELLFYSGRIIEVTLNNYQKIKSGWSNY